MPGRFIVLEGPDGVGKSTQAPLLAERLGALCTREPGGTDIGRRIRELLLDRATVGLDARSEALLMAADRAQHVAEQVRPALAAGRHVVADRFLYSSVAYQGYGRGLPPEEIRHLSAWAADGLEPDLVLLLDGPCRRAGAGDRLEDELEDEDDGFRARVHAGYRAQADADPARWARVDASGDVEATAAEVARIVRDRLGLEA